MQTLEDSGGLGDPDLTSSMQQGGVDSKRTLDKMKSIGGKSLSRGLENVRAWVSNRVAAAHAVTYAHVMPMGPV